MGKEAMSTAAIEKFLKRCFEDKVVTSKEHIQNSSDTVKIKVEQTESQYFTDDPRETYYNNKPRGSRQSYYGGKKNFSDRNRGYSSGNSYLSEWQAKASWQKKKQQSRGQVGHYVQNDEKVTNSTLWIQRLVIFLGAMCAIQQDISRHSVLTTGTVGAKKFWIGVEYK